MMPAIMEPEIANCSQFHERLPTGIDASHPFAGRTWKHQRIVAGLALPPVPRCKNRKGFGIAGSAACDPISRSPPQRSRAWRRS